MLCEARALSLNLGSMTGILKSREARWALIWIGLVTLFRLWFSHRLDLVGDEAHYWECGRSLDWSHYGKGPGAAFVIRMFTWLLGDWVWVVRLPAVLLAAGTGWLIFLLGRTFYDDRVGLVAVVAASVMPLFAVGSILMTIDPLSVFFWAAAALTFWKAMEEPARKRHWAFTGLLVGLGFQAKYTNAAELICFLAFLLLVPEKRRLILSRGTFFMLGMFFLFTIPILLWNAFREWIGAVHVFEGGDFDRGFRPDFGKFAGFWLLQAIVVSPLMFLVMLAAAVRPKESAKPHGSFYLQCLFWPLFLGYAWVSLNKTANGNWTAPALVSGLVLGTGWALSKWDTSRVAGRVFLAAALFVGLVLTALLHDFLPLRLKNNPLDRAKGWKDLATEAHKVREQIGANFVVADEYQTASLLSFYLPDRPRAFTPDWPQVMTQYSLWPSYRETYPAGSTALYVAEQPNPLPPIARDFESVRIVGTYRRTSWGQPMGPTFHFYECRGLKVGQPTTWKDRLEYTRQGQKP
ncbi:MAG: phospholipid carrier-dependent glycosyltransferase [Verrucomicrobia bacterium]|nr:phospholipid carrier-dependent glycosyltransferase [Verrucomicrobiota bacterium]